MRYAFYLLFFVARHPVMVRPVWFVGTVTCPFIFFILCIAFLLSLPDRIIFLPSPEMSFFS